MITLPSGCATTIRILPKQDGDFYHTLYMLCNSMDYKFCPLDRIQEWQWCEGDVSINMVNGSRDEGVSIYINEQLVGRFAPDSRLYPRLYPPHNFRVADGDVCSAMIAFIDKWELGV